SQGGNEGGGWAGGGNWCPCPDKVLQGCWCPRCHHTGTRVRGAEGLGGDGGGGGGGRGALDNKEQEGQEEELDLYDQCPCVVASLELVAVVLVWTGVEWYIWDDDYIEESALRDLVYIALGMGILVGTGTFCNYAGMISPMAILRQVR
ncbi:unnamed protein product, partial [Discosporangium mesarthrocarpum]